MKSNGPGTPGITCHLADGTEVYSRQACGYVVDDSRGIHHTSMQKQSPCYVGACKECDLLGVKSIMLTPKGHMCYYPSACASCKGKEAKQRYTDDNKLDDGLGDRADPEYKPKPMTHEKALASGQRGEAEGRKAKHDTVAYHGTSRITFMRIHPMRTRITFMRIDPVRIHPSRLIRCVCIDGARVLGHRAVNGERSMPRDPELARHVMQPGDQQWSNEVL
jgi:hypothetical protein